MKNMSNCSNEVQPNLVVANRCFEILTPTGFMPFKGVRKVTKKEYYKLHFTDGHITEVSSTHRVLKAGESECVFVKDLKPGDKLQGKGNQIVEISEIEHFQEDIGLYDIVEVENHLFISDGFVSHNCNFLSSGNTVIEPDDLTYYEETYQCDPIERRGLTGDYWLWQQPDYTRNYIISADVARGDGSDFSAFHVFDVETVEQVAEYKGKVAPRDFGAFLVAVATEWNGALLVVENASVGWSTIEEILARGYNNLYYGTTNQTETAESYATKLDRDRLTPGFTMSSRTRPLVIAKMTEYIHDKSVVFHSKRLGLELRTFIWLNGKAQAQEGYHDDLVMSFGTCLYVRDTALRLRQQGLDLSKAQLNAFGDLNKKDPAVYTNTRPLIDPYKVYNPKGGYEDISWLLK